MPIKMFCKDANAIVTVYKFDIPSIITLGLQRNKIAMVGNK